MAKAQAVKIIRVPSMRAAGARAGNLARRAGSAAGRWAKEEKHTVGALGAAAVLGFLSRPSADGGPSTAEKLPHIRAIGVPGTYGLALYAVARMSKSHVAGHMATGLMSIALFELAKTGNAGGTSAVSGEL